MFNIVSFYPVDQVVVMLCFRLVLHDLVDQVVMMCFKLLLHDVVDRVVMMCYRLLLDENQLNVYYTGFENFN